MATTKLEFSNDPKALDGVTQLVVLGTKNALARAEVVAALPEGVAPIWGAMLEVLAPGDQLDRLVDLPARAGHDAPAHDGALAIGAGLALGLVPGALGVVGAGPLPAGRGAPGSHQQEQQGDQGPHAPMLPGTRVVG